VNEQGVWRDLYIQADDNMTLVDDDEPGSYRVYARVHGILRFLRQQTLEDSAPDRMKAEDVGHARLMDVTYDPFRQTIHIAPLFRPSIAHMADRVPFADMAAEFSAQGLTFVNQYPCPRSYPRPSTGKLGKRCNACVITTDAGPCESATQGGVCKFCYSYGRPCTWTWFPGAVYVALKADPRHYLLTAQPAIATIEGTEDVDIISATAEF